MSPNVPSGALDAISFSKKFPQMLNYLLLTSTNATGVHARFH